MKLIKSPYLVEIQEDTDDTVIFRLTIVGHLTEEQIETSISELECTMLDAFMESFESISNALIGLRIFSNSKCLERIPDFEMPILDERKFSIEELLNEGSVEKSLIINDMYDSLGGFLREKTLIYADAIKSIRPHLKWIDYWSSTETIEG